MNTPKLKPANKNPWYILMTLYGEQEGGGTDRELADKNRKLWNAWVCRGMSDEDRYAIADKIGIDRSEVDWSKEKAQEVAARFVAEWQGRNDGTVPPEMPSAGERIDLSETAFSNTVVLEKAIFLETNFSGAQFGERTSFGQAQFGRWTSFSRAYFGKTIGFGGAHFGERTSFSGAHFDRTIGFDNAHFGPRTSFSDAHFGEAASFIDTQFGERTSFIDTHFGERTSFIDTQFGKATYFIRAHFGERTSFIRAHFGKTTSFSDAHFGESTDFGGAHFGEETFFSRAHFGETTNFSGAHFGEITDFSGAQFARFCYFSGAQFGTGRSRWQCRSDFSNASFGGPTSFEKARFASDLPVLTGATLHDTTTVTANPSDWPHLAPGTLAELDYLFGLRKHVPSPLGQDRKIAKASAAKLRHVMSKQALPEEEHFFFRIEMHHAARTGSRLSRAPYLVYEALSNFGHSIGRPAALLGLLWLVGWAVYATQTTLGVAKSGAYSFATMFKFFGLQGTYLSKETENLTEGMQLFAATQTVLAFILLFFLGLGLRTRFRLR